MKALKKHYESERHNTAFLYTASVVLIVLMFVANTGVIGQERKKYYRDSLISISIDKYLSRERKYQKYRSKKEKITFDVSSLPETYLYDFPDSLYYKYQDIVEWVNSQNPTMIKRYKRSKRGVPTIDFGWNIDGDGRLRISFGQKYISIKKKMLEITRCGECGASFFYKFSKNTKQWELVDAEPAEDFMFPDYPDSIQDPELTFRAPLYLKAYNLIMNDFDNKNELMLLDTVFDWSSFSTPQKDFFEDTTDYYFTKDCWWNHYLKHIDTSNARAPQKAYFFSAFHHNDTASAKYIICFYQPFNCNNYVSLDAEIFPVKVKHPKGNGFHWSNIFIENGEKCFWFDVIRLQTTSIYYRFWFFSGSYSLYKYEKNTCIHE